MKYLFSILLLVLSAIIARSGSVKGSVIQHEISKEFYWLGFSMPTENLFCTGTNSWELPICIEVHEKHIAEMNHISEICNVKFKRNKELKDCSNCHQWFRSVRVNKEWVYEKYYSYEPKAIYDSTSQMQWYKPHFRSEVISNATDNEKLSFLAGTFLRCGKVDNSLLIFTIDESPEKSLCIKETLDYFKCENISFTSLENIPEDVIIIDNRTIISFSPSPLITAFFKTEIDIRK